MEKCADAVREKSSLADFLQIHSHLESLDMSFQICTSLRQPAMFTDIFPSSTQFARLQSLPSPLSVWPSKQSATRIHPTTLDLPEEFDLIGDVP